MQFVADFETTTDPEDCRVWAFGVCPVNDPDRYVYGNNIAAFFQYIHEQPDNMKIWIHNLRFDAEFIICYLFKEGYKHVKDKTDLADKTFTTLISDKGIFYCMTVVFEKKNKKTHKAEFFDSLKVLPFSLDAVAKGFSLPISKLKIDYEKKRPVGHELTKREQAYLKNDVVILAMALNVLFTQNLTRMTTGSNALHDFKATMSEYRFDRLFPPPDYDDLIRESYKGGYTYLNPKYKGKDCRPGIVLDVNSLYPSVMRYKPLPFGEGVHYVGEYQKSRNYSLYIQTFKCQFELKKGYIPTIQLKKNLSFMATEYVTSSKNEEITLCLTSVDLDLFFKHYDVFNVEFMEGWKFRGYCGLFDDYIDKWVDIKNQSTIDGNSAMRTLSKLMLNSLYGKFSSSPKGRSKYPVDDHGAVRYIVGELEDRKPVYIPVGTFITAWARHVTISAAQQLYDRFIYADTDSLHLTGLELPSGIEIDKVKLGAWKHELNFRRARFVRQKTYMEQIELSSKDYKKLEMKEKRKTEVINGKRFQWKVTCAGMPEKLHEQVDFSNFHEGSSYEGKLRPVHCVGGVVLMNTDFTIRKG